MAKAVTKAFTHDEIKEVRQALVNFAVHNATQGKKKVLLRAVKTLDEMAMAARQRAIFETGAKARRPKPSYNGEPLGCIEECTWYDGYVSTHPGFVNPYRRT